MSSRAAWRGGTDRAADWRDQAACRLMDTELWFPTTGEAAPAARAACERCPVAGACLAWALDHERHGCWAGTTAEERTRLRREYGIKLDDLSPHSYLHLSRPPERRSA